MAAPEGWHAAAARPEVVPSAAVRGASGAGPGAGVVAAGGAGCGAAPGASGVGGASVPVAGAGAGRGAGRRARRASGRRAKRGAGELWEAAQRENEHSLNSWERTQAIVGRACAEIDGLLEGEGGSGLPAGLRRNLLDIRRELGVVARKARNGIKHSDRLALLLDRTNAMLKEGGRAVAGAAAAGGDLPVLWERVAVPAGRFAPQPALERLFTLDGVPRALAPRLIGLGVRGGAYRLRLARGLWGRQPAV